MTPCRLVLVYRRFGVNVYLKTTHALDVGKEFLGNFEMLESY